MKRNLIAVGFGLALPVGAAVVSVLASLAVGAAMSAARGEYTRRRPSTR
jgi:hypothetical protein